MGNSGPGELKTSTMIGLDSSIANCEDLGFLFDPIPFAHFLYRFMGVLSHSCEYVPDIFFLSVILFFGTFFTCTFIKNFKYTPFFPTKASLS